MSIATRPRTEGMANLFWGEGEIPYRGEQAPLLKKHEFNKLEKVVDFKSRMFFLNKDEDKKDFDEIYDKHCSGSYRVCKRIERWNEQTQHLQIWLEWVQIYLESPAEER